jgi:BASS family bile acid:Na+ symporter
MFGVGLTLRWKEFRFIVSNWNVLVWGLSIKMLIVPFLSFLLLSLTNLPLVTQFGILLILACPGGTTSNLITYWSKGAVVLTIFLTVISGFVATFTISALINYGSSYFFDQQHQVSVPFWDTSGKITLLIIIPTIMGMAVKYYSEKVADKMESFLRPVSVVFLAIVYLLKFFKPASLDNGDYLSWNDIRQLLPVLLALNIGSILFGYFISLKIGIEQIKARTIGIEMGVQNIPLAILVGDVLLNNAELSKPALLYAMFTFWTTLGFAYWAKRKESSNTDE